MILMGLERIAFQGRVWLSGFLKMEKRSTDETEEEVKPGYIHLYARQDASGNMKLYYRDDDQVERLIQTTP